MRRWILIAALAVSAGWLSTCETTAPLLPADDGPRSHVLHVVSNGWHTAIVIPRPAIAATGLLPEAADFPDAAFLEFGWGDRTYYPAKKKTLGMALGAALTATPAVMYMAGLAVPPRQAGGGAEVLRVTLSETGFRRLVRALADQFERPAGGRTAPISRGLYPDSNFYNADGTFYLFNTCNTWTARVLRAGGLRLSPAGIITATGLMTRLRVAIGEDEHLRPVRPDRG